MKTVAIVGVGLVGASFALAIRQAGFTGEIVGVSSSEALSAARKLGAISDSAALEEACRRADLIYLSQPVDRILSTIPRVGPLVAPGTLVTDAGSTKVTIVRKAAECLPHTEFIGGHPMAGKEKSGAEAADANLFCGRPYILAPPSGPPSPHGAAFRDLLGRIGANIVELDAHEHDRTVAFTSHLPQLISTALASTLAHQEKGHLQEIFGPGLLDMTRLALSSEALWASILAENREPALEALDEFQEQLRCVRKAVETNNLGELFSSAKSFASTIRKRPS
ncbi:MAG TPA: prephenate dehydrogenase/arogenate dehydrogenase family protein [Bryobacteraceae bacterium]|nr:prephenate dehydrogenase/arogenate dehydrogenase family protein [Bryobacteraceae bacterium]